MQVSAKHLFRLGISIALSVFVLALMLRLLPGGGGEVSPAVLWKTLRSVSVAALGLYLVCQIGQTLFRAMRYRLLLQGDGVAEVPGLAHTGLVTFARNMFVDLVPARGGELTYVAMMNRGYNVSGEACLSSLTVSMLFDFLALWLVLAGAIMTPVLQAGGRGALLGAMIMLSAVIVVGWIGLFYLPRPLLRLARRILGRLADWKWMAILLSFADKVVDSLERVRRSGRLARVLGLSALVRLFKYAGLLFLFRGVAAAISPELAGAPAWTILITLVAGEGAASLPVPAFMSFGTYEAGGTAALSALGFAAGDAALVTLALHIWSQVVDYSLGGLSMLVYSWTVNRERVVAESPRWSLLLRFAALGLAGVVAAGSLAVGARAWMKFRKSAEQTPPTVGEVVPGMDKERSQLQGLVEGLEGFVVWSSNRHGNHEILYRSLPDLKERRLTDNGFTDTYPRISPDGAQVVFCRSKLPYVSQRDPIPWDVYLVDLKTGKEQLLARDGNTPTWSVDGTTVYFQRAGGQLVQHELASGDETVLFASGKGLIPPGLQLQTPDYHDGAERLAVTVRGSKRGTWLIGKDESFQRIGGGCQLAWAPDASFLYYIDHGGVMENQLYKVDPGTSERTPWLDLPEPFSHEYFPRLDRTQNVLAIGAAASGHEHDRADYEIFLWKPGTPAGEAARFTFHTGNDCWPDVFLAAPR